MSLTELLPLIQELSYSDKLHALQFLMLELAKEEGRSLRQKFHIRFGRLEVFAAAGVLLDVLERGNPSAHA